MKASKSLTILSCMAMCVASLEAFVVPRQYHYGTTPFQSLQLCMVGGRGWDNDDFLSGLSGGDEERQKAADEYREFSENRKAFMDRQQEIMKTPQGREFLQKQQQQQMARDMDDGPPFPDSPDIPQPLPGSGGGSRMAQMLTQANKMKQMQQELKEMGFEQKLAVPLDDDEDDVDE